jgi:iron complex outermembrane receptor protein
MLMMGRTPETSVVRGVMLATVSMAAMLMATPAFAQDNPAPAAQDNQAAPGDEIVVTAQFREQNLQDIPLAITAVNSEMMEAKSQTNLAQLADTAPNVTFKPQGASFGPSITASIRGVGQNDFNPAFEPGVAIYIDDVYYPQLTGAVFDLLDLDRVEILRGPQGILTGRNSEGGAIKLFSRKPSGEGGGFVEATYGDGNRIGVRGAADFTLADGLYGRISGTYKRQDGYVDRLDFGCVYPAGGSATFINAQGVATPRNPAVGGIAAGRPSGKCKLSELGGIGYGAVKGTLRYAPNDALDITISGDYVHDEHTVAGEVLQDTNVINSPNTNAAPNVPNDNRFICGRFCNFAGTGQPAITWQGGITPGMPIQATSGTDQSVYDGWGVSGKVHYELSDSISIDSITGYRQFSTQFDTDDDLSPSNLNYGINDLTNWNVSQEVRLGVKLMDKADLTLGGFYFKQKSVYDSIQDIRYLYFLFPLQFRQPDQINADAKAVFGHLSWEVVPGLNLSGGLRYTKESKDYTYYRFSLNGSVNPLLDGVGAAYGVGYNGPDTNDIDGDGNTTEIVSALSGNAAHYKGSKVDWRVAADYRISPELLVYGTVSTGFKGGGTNPRPFNAGQVISFDPETLTAYEIGFKSDLFDRHVRLNVSAFINDIKDVQIPVLSCPDSPCAARLNAGDGKVKGFEAEFTAHPVQGLLIDASLSYIDFQFKNLAANAVYPTNRGGVALTDPQGGVPKWKWSFGAQYAIPLGSAGSLTPRFDIAYQAKQYTGPVVVGTPRTVPTTPSANEVRSLTFIPSYTLANARLTWQNDPKDLSVSFEVTNLFNKYYYLTVFDLLGAGAGFRKGQPGRPREWAVTVKKTF